MRTLIEKVVTSDPVARKVARAAKLDDRLGQLAYDGQFASAGIIASSYQDHGVGRNLLKHKAVELSGYPYAMWVYNNTVATDRELVYIGGGVEQDTVALSGDLNIASLNRPIMLPQSGFELNVPGIFSAYCYLAYDAEVRILVRQAATYADALTNVGTSTLLATGDTLTGLAGETIRPTLSFTPTQPYLRYEFRVTRTGGGLAGTSLKTAHWFNFMQEAITTGQTKPSKFVLPIPNRGDVAANLIEADALKGYISGLEISYVSSTQVAVSSGAAYIPGLARAVRYTGANITPTMNTTTRHYYLYLYEDASGVGQIEVSTTVPTPYQGTAKNKTGDTSRRYLGAINNTLLPAVRRFEREGNLMLYTDDDWREEVLSGGSATARTTVSCSPYIPSGVVTMWLVGAFAGGVIAKAYVSRPGDALNPAAGQAQATMEITGSSNRGNYTGWVRCDGARDIEYANSVTGVNTYLYARGYWDAR